MRHASIRTHLIVMVAALALPLAGLAAYVVWAETDVARRAADRRVMEAAETTAEAIGQFVWDGQQTLSGMAGRPAIRAMDPASCRAFLGEANEVLQQYTNLFLVRADGALVCSAIPPPPGRESAADARWYAEAVQREGFNASRPQYGRISETWITVFSQPVRDEDGSVQGYLGASVNLSRFRDLLRAAELEAGGVVTLAHADRTVIARSDDASWTDRKLPPVEGGDQHVLRGSGVQEAPGLDGVPRVWGYRTVPNSDWLVYAGIPATAIHADTRREAVGTAVAALLMMGLLAVLAGGVYRHVTGALRELVDGVESAATGSSKAIATGGPAEVVKVAQAFNRTLAARGRAEAGLRRSKERYQSILRNAVFGIYVSNREGRLLEANPALAEMLGYDDPEELLALPMDRFYKHPDERGRLVEEAVEGTGSGVVDVEWVRKDGSPLQARLYVSVTSDLDGEIAFEGMVEDLTERRDLEEQLRQSQKLEAVGRLAGGVAHDFNNRLTVIQGQAGLLLADLPDESPALENVEAILESALKASELTAQLLAFGRKQVARPRLLDLNEVVRNLARVLPKLMGEDIVVEHRLHPEPVRIVADPGQIDQVLLNLCTNARDAMPDGGRLVIATEMREHGFEERLPPGLDAGRYAVLAVTDDGHGMDEGVRARLFEPFFTTKSEEKGTGLGLSTAYGLIKQAGGDIEVVTAPDAGAAFYIWLPLRTEVDASAPDVRPREVVRDPAPLRTLLVEDESEADRGAAD